MRIGERDRLGAIDGERERRDRDIGPAGKKGRYALRGGDLNELELDAHVLGKLLGRGNLGAVGFAILVEDAERRRSDLSRDADLLVLQDFLKRRLRLGGDSESCRQNEGARHSQCLKRRSHRGFLPVALLF